MRMMRFLQSAAFLGTLAFFLPATAEAQCNLESLRPGLNDNCTVNVGGRARVFDVVVPQQRGGDLSVVVDFHGFGSNENQQRQGSGLGRLVMANKIVQITPRGIANSFNGQACCGTAQQQNVDDVAFARAAIAAVNRSLNITPVITASSGISNGMTMSNRIACQAGGDFELVAGVSFQLTRNLQGCRPAPGTIYSEFHATQDNVVPFGGGLLGTANAAQAPRALAQLRGCDMAPQMSRLNSNTTCQTFNGCMGGGLVQMCTVTPGNHVLYPTVADPDFDVAFERLLDMAIQIKRGGARAGGDNMTPAAPAPSDPAPADPSSN